MADEPTGQAIVECLSGITSMAMSHALSELAAGYERRTGQRVVVEAVGGVDAARRIESGEPFDFVVLAAEAIDKLTAAGRLDPDTRTDLARSSVAIAVRAGAHRPDVRSEQTVRDAVVAARSIGYSTGPSGRHLLRLLERWGIADIVAPRTVEAPPGVAVGTLVARGDVEIGFQQSSELIHVSGIDIIGLLPPEIQVITVFSAAVTTGSRHAVAASALLAFLASSDADAVKRRLALEPARTET